MALEYYSLREKNPVCIFYGEDWCSACKNADYLAMIWKLKAENAELKRERDAAVNELKLGYACFACSYFFRNGGKCKGGSTCMERSESCSVFGAEYSGLYFKWRGPCEENGGQKEEEKMKKECKFQQEYDGWCSIRCMKDGSIRHVKGCGKNCPHHRPTLWQRLKEWWRRL